MSALIKQIKAARRAGVPILAIDTPDPGQTIRTIVKEVNSGTAFTEWDICNGLTGLNKAGENLCIALAQAAGVNNIKECTNDPASMLDTIRKIPENAMVFMHNAHRLIDGEIVAQAVWNLRDLFKARGCNLVLLSPGIRMPDQLSNDVVILNEEYPTTDEIRVIVDRIIANAKQAGAKIEIAEDGMNQTSDTLTGLSAFSAEQTLAMCLSKEGVDMDELWQRKRKTVEQTDGLALYRGGDTFKDIGGCENIKQFLRDLMSGPSKFSSFFWLDELEKMLAGAGGDTSGTSQDQLGVILRVMQDWNLPGIMFIGHPGTAKSAISKAAGAEFGVPVVQGDLGAMKGSLVGESERKIRTAMKVFKAISNGRGCVIATCNKLGAMPPELRRRFKLGIYVFDLPTQEERDLIWPIHHRKFELGKFSRAKLGFSDEGWTGAEIAACCELSWRTGKSLLECSKRIVPICRSANDAIQQLRDMAHGKFISASYPGVYERPSAQEVSKERKIEL